VKGCKQLYKFNHPSEKNRDITAPNCWLRDEFPAYNNEIFDLKLSPWSNREFILHLYYQKFSNPKIPYSGLLPAGGECCYIFWQSFNGILTIVIHPNVDSNSFLRPNPLHSQPQLLSSIFHLELVLSCKVPTHHHGNQHVFNERQHQTQPATECRSKKEAQSKPSRLLVSRPCNGLTVVPLTFSREPNSLITFIVVEDDKEFKFTVHKEVSLLVAFGIFFSQLCRTPHFSCSIFGAESVFSLLTLSLLQVACSHSPVLNAAFNSDFLEGQTQIYRLEDTTPRAVRLLVQWLYCEKLRLLQLEDDWKYQAGDDDNCESSKSEDKSLVELWVLADRLIMPCLQNEVLRRINQIREKNRLSPTSCFVYVYNNTASNSPLRRYFVRDVYHRLSAEGVGSEPERFPHQMLLEVLILHAERSNHETQFSIRDLFVPEGGESETAQI